MTYSFSDGSGGVLPEEMRLDVMDAAMSTSDSACGNGIYVLGKIWDWKDRLERGRNESSN